jgi:hypothetical protein
VPSVDIADDTFVVADPEALAAMVRDPDNWDRWWPDLRLEVEHDRGPKGMQWSVTGAVAGSMEIWIEPVADGAVVHYYLRSELAGSRRPGAVMDGRRRAWKREIHAVKDALEADREPGRPRVPTDRVKEPRRSAD